MEIKLQILATWTLVLAIMEGQFSLILDLRYCTVQQQFQMQN